MLGKVWNSLYTKQTGKSGQISIWHEHEYISFKDNKFQRQSLLILHDQNQSKSFIKTFKRTSPTQELVSLIIWVTS